MWVLLDNHDSFTYILNHYLLETGQDCRVIRNDELPLWELIALQPERLILSPGPERPAGAGIMMEAIAHFHDKIPVLGICLGHQGLGEFFGAKLVHARYPMHGKISAVSVQTTHPLFEGMPETIEVMRYHSLVLEGLEGAHCRVLATADDDGACMVMAHEHFPSIGIQFHPESIGTPQGKRLLSNWAKMEFRSNTNSV